MAVSRPHIRQPMQPVPLLDPADREFLITQLLYSAQHASIHVTASKGARGNNKTKELAMVDLKSLSRALQFLPSSAFSPSSHRQPSPSLI